MTHISESNRELVIETRSAYFVLVTALDELRPLNIFSLFLSTTSNLAHFPPNQEAFKSSRSRNDKWDLQAPLNELPFDLCEPGEFLFEEGIHTLTEVCTVAFMSKFGRPL